MYNPAGVPGVLALPAAHVPPALAAAVRAHAAPGLGPACRAGVQLPELRGKPAPLQEDAGPACGAAPAHPGTGNVQGREGDEDHKFSAHYRHNPSYFLRRVSGRLSKFNVHPKCKFPENNLYFTYDYWVGQKVNKAP